MEKSMIIRPPDLQMLVECLGDTERLQINQIKLVRLKDEYIRFSKGIGQRTQYARMETAGFNWKQAKEAEKIYERKVNAVAAGAVFVQKNDQLAINAKKITPIEWGCIPCGRCFYSHHGKNRYEKKQLYYYVVHLLRSTGISFAGNLPVIC